MDQGFSATEGLMKTLVLKTSWTENVVDGLRRAGQAWILLAGVTLLFGTSGCTAFHPVRGVPASYLPDQFIGPSRDNKRTIDLSLLVRTPPDQYRVEAGDVLSIFVPRVLGVETTDVNSVGIAPPINMPTSLEDPPTVGFPIQIRDDNTISLPQIPPLFVGKMTLHEVEQAIFKAYTETYKILNPSEAMVMVSLQRPRITRVLVVRQEASTTLTTSTGAGSVNIGTSGKGTARTVTLKAYENDVLHALAHVEGVDGLPGLDAENVIYIIRRRPRASAPKDFMPAMPQSNRMTPVSPSSIRPVSGVMDNGSQHVHTAGYDQTIRGQSPSGQPPYGQASYSQPPHGQPFQGYRSGTGHNGPQSGLQPVQHVMAPQSSLPYSSEPYFAQNAVQYAPQNSVQPAPYGHSSQTPQPYGQRQSLQRELTGPVSPLDHVNALSDSQRPMNGQRPSTIQPTQYQAPLPYGQHTSGGVGGHSFATVPPSYGPISAPEMEPTLAPPGYQSPAYGDPQGAQLVQEWSGAPVDQNWASMLQRFDPTIDNPNVIRIPVRLGPGEVPQITEDQITLHDGDIIFIESRETEVFYTAGLLGGGQYTLPRDYDLGVLEAVSIAESQNVGGGGNGRSLGGVSALNHDVSISASRMAIIRTLPNGKRITIEVDLRRAMRYQEENIRIQPGDVLVLEYTFGEAVSAFANRYLLEGALFGVAAGMMMQGR